MTAIYVAGLNSLSAGYASDYILELQEKIPDEEQEEPGWFTTENEEG